jgi:phosphate starvation-inducible PhoH-like protein
LCGELNQNLHTVERQLAVEVAQRANHFKIIGPDEAVEQARVIITTLYAKNLNPADIPQELHLLLASIPNQNKTIDVAEREDLNDAIIKTPKETIKPRGVNQLRYIKRIHNHDISFGIGPAGTGKTFLAVACAVAALSSDQVARIVLVRPAVEAGEHLGFLPGDLSQKVDPYLRPMYDALYELMGTEKVLKLIERQVIEIAPLAFMRGRTLNDAFIILDEAQNTTKEQMKMFLTRIGFQSTAVINGDITQIDLPKGKLSGLRHAIDVLTNVKGISFTFFGSADVVRHPLVQKIVEAYDHHEETETL